MRIELPAATLTRIGTEVAAGDGPRDVTVDPSGQFVYVVNGASDDITVFRVDAATGSLTPAGAPAPAGDGPTSIAIVAAYQ